MTSSDEIVRGTSLVALFARGELDRVIAAHLRAPAATSGDRAAVVGAYAWSGRLDEALALHDSFLAADATDAYREDASAQLVIGLCHAGRLRGARRRVRDADSIPLPADSPAWYHRWYAQAFVAYFRGRMRRCRRAARQALRAATAAGHAFGQLLAHDLLAHAALHRGRAGEAARLLAHASHLAGELNLADNYRNLLVTRRIVAVTIEPRDDAAAAALAALVPDETLRYFVRRHGHWALAIAAAVRGDLARARAEMAAAASLAIGADARAAVRLHAARGGLAAIEGDRAAAVRELGVALARAQRSRHLDLYAEAAFLHRLVLDEPVVPRGAAARADLVRLAWARGDDVDAGDDVLLGLARDRERARGPQAWIDAGLPGLAAIALPPGDAIGVLAGGVLLRSAQAVTYVPATSEITGRLLTALARGPRRKAELVKELWGLGVYHPHLHDGTLYTAVSRLRRAWGAQGAWVERTVDGYQLARGVALVTLDAGAGGGDGDDAPTAPSARATHTLHDRLVAAVTDEGITCAEAARAARVSSSTALRALRELVSGGQVIRVGGGSQTRYARVR